MLQTEKVDFIDRLDIEGSVLDALTELPKFIRRNTRMAAKIEGMLPFGMTLNYLKSGVSKIRNPVIARVLRELDYMEKWGTGYRRIIPDCDDGGYPHPEWRKRMKNRGFSQADLAGELGVSRARVTQVMNVLKLLKVRLDDLRTLGDPMVGKRITERMLRKTC